MKLVASPVMDPGDVRRPDSDLVGDRVGDLLPALESYADIVHLDHQPARPGVVGTPSRPVDPTLRDELGFRHLWSHQAQAIDLIREGNSVAITTGTGSGKSLCYQIPILESAQCPDGPGTALLVFPTKALAHDQLRTLVRLDLDGVEAATYDGDAGPEHRTWARKNATIVLTNPEMLHSGILANHRRWAPFLARLRHVVIDEFHVLRGVFGTNVAHVLRRLRRLAAAHGADPTFVFTSASLGNAAELGSRLCGRPVTEVGRDGSARSARTFVLADPQGRRRSSIWRASAGITAELVDAGLRTLTFCPSRKQTELVTEQVRHQLDDPETVGAYRGGYLADERRDIETDLWAGELQGVVATSALELGVDIGHLDATVLAGYPGTISSLWQRAGRVGRNGRHGLTVLVAGADQLDRWFVAHPDALTRRRPEPAAINTNNRALLVPNLHCAAHELPIDRGDGALWPDLDEAMGEVIRSGEVWIRRRRDRDPLAVWSSPARPHHRVGLRGGSGGSIQIVANGGDLIGTVGDANACRDVHPGAIYHHRGELWRVTELDLDARSATVEPSDGATRTQPRSETTLRILETDERVGLGTGTAGLGTVEVESRVTGYRVRDTQTGDVIGSEDLELPARHLVTRGFWLEVGAAAHGIDDVVLPGALHAAEHAAIGLLPLFAICDRWDVGGVSTAHHADTGQPTVVVYEGYAQGAGIAELGFGALASLVDATIELIEGCGCDEGCPSCVQSPKCGNGNEPLDKDAAVLLLRTLLDHDRAASSRSAV